MSDRKYKLYSDSTCDLSEDILKNMDVTLLDLSFEVNGVVKSKNDMTLAERSSNENIANRYLRL